MDFNLSDEQTMLKEGAERYLNENYSFDQRRVLAGQAGAVSEPHWRQFADMGWLALPIAEKFDGLGGSLVDISLLQETLGGSLVREPFATTSVLGAFLIEGCEQDDLRSAALRDIAAGKLRVALAHAEADARYDLANVGMQARPAFGGFQLTGRKITVWDAPSAHRLIVSAILDGEREPSLFWVERPASGLEETEYEIIDSTHAADLGFNAVPARMLLSSEQAASRLGEAIDRLTLARVAETLGIMERILAITAEQLRNRVQFGQPLSKFQALQHRMAEMFVEVQETRSILYRGLALVDEPSERATAVSAAKVVAIGAARMVGAQGIQLHGGVGMTDDYAVGHYFKRLLALEKQYGDMDYHVGRIAKHYRGGIDESRL